MRNLPSPLLPPRPNSPTMLIGYGRVSTDGQSLDAQLHALTIHGCTTVFREHASGAKDDRPQLAAALAACQPGDTLVVVKLDRLARSVRHLCHILETLHQRGAHFHSLGDAIDTSTPTGMFTFHILGAVAEFERKLAHARTLAGLAHARTHGRVGGNPALRTPEGRAALAATRAANRLAKARARQATPA